MRLALLLTISFSLLSACTAETEPRGGTADGSSTTTDGGLLNVNDSDENEMKDENYRCMNNGGESEFLLFIYDLKARETPTGRTVIEGMFRVEGNNYMLDETGDMTLEGSNYMIGDFEFESDDDGNIFWVSEGSGDSISCERT